MKKKNETFANITTQLGALMDEEIATSMDELEHLVLTGYSSNGIVKAEVDGTHKVIGISIEDDFNNLASDKKEICALITEAINDAIYKIDLAFETKITNIQFKFTGDAITKIVQPSNIKNTYKKYISDMREK